MEIGDTFIHNGINYTVTLVVSPTEIIAMGFDPDPEENSGFHQLPQRLKINPADISG